MTGTYRSSPISRSRRSREDMDAIRGAMHTVIAEDPPMTVRQVFYRMIGTGLIAKTESEYKQTVCRLLSEMRLQGAIPFGWIADNTRWMRKPTTHSSMQSALSRTAEAYRRSVWDAQDVYVEVWLEKDALAGVVMDATAPWDVPLMVTRGYPSLSYMFEAAGSIRDAGKPTYIYYLGDHDPSGIDIPRNVEARLRQFAPESEIHFECLAVRPEHIALWSLPTRPTKTTDSRNKGFEGESVEVDAIRPSMLRTLVTQAITQHVDAVQHEVLLVAERSERELLHLIAADYRGAA